MASNFNFVGSICFKCLLGLVLFDLFLSHSIYSQSLTPFVITTTAGEFQHQSKGSLTWTLGEVAVEAHLGTGSSLTQGFHQGNLVILQEESNSGPILDFRLSPNPNYGRFQLTLSASTSTSLELQIINTLGQVVRQGIFVTLKPGENNYELHLSGLNSGIYLISFLQGTQRINLTRRFARGYLQERKLKANPFIKFVVF